MASEYRYAVQKQRPDGTWYTFFRYYSEAEARNKLAYEWNHDETAILRIINEDVEVVE